MARRSLLTGDERRRLFELSMDDREVARHYTLSADDLKWPGALIAEISATFWNICERGLFGVLRLTVALNVAV